MQRLFQILLLTVLTSFSSQAQQPLGTLDSIHQELLLAKNDTAKMKTMHALAGFYAESNRDSALYYLEKALLIADEFKLPISRAHILLLKSYMLQKQAKYTLSLRLCNEVLALLDDRTNEKDIYIWDRTFISQPARYREMLKISVYHQLGNTYSGVDDKDKAIQYYQKEIDIAKQLNVSGGTVTSNMNIGSIYAELNQLDSAEWYSRRALENVQRSGWRAYEGYILDDIGRLFLKRDQYDSAMGYFRQAILVNRKQNNLAGESGSCNSMAELFRKTRQADSMLFYARAALSAGIRLNSGRAIAISNEQVADAWKLKGNPDSAYLYLLASKKMGDSLHNNYSKSITEFQKSNFEEQIQSEREAQISIAARNRTRTFALILGIGVLSILAFVFYRNNIQKRKANRQLESTLTDLKATQAQLIQSEKMASLGELTAGIAHEIQNPLNFVNNFSEVNKELISELVEEVDKGNTTEVKSIAADIRENSEKINHHGKRADAIVKGMLQHSRAGNGKKEPTDINALCDEYLRLAYHGIRAKDKSFNATMKTDFDASIGKVNIIPQDIGRVVLNLITNAFYAVQEKTKTADAGYEPTVSISTASIQPPLGGRSMTIKVSDNGGGIPPAILDKIFQPFFTTKPTGQGTGLGLSMSYDIVTKGHGGELLVESREGEYTQFTIILPL